MKTKSSGRLNMKTQVYLLASMLLLLAMSTIVMAVDFNQTISSQDKSTFDQILSPVMKIYNLVKYAASAVAGVVLLFAGISYMTSGSDPKKRENSKGMAMYVVIGLIVIWAAPMIVGLIVG
jgi:multisubunit Na+/H+ antiporter MnhB subunit